ERLPVRPAARAAGRPTCFAAARSRRGCATAPRGRAPSREPTRGSQDSCAGSRRAARSRCHRRRESVPAPAARARPPGGSLQELALLPLRERVQLRHVARAELVAAVRAELVEPVVLAEHLAEARRVA